MKKKREVTLESLLKRHPAAADCIERAKRFPLREPVRVINQTTDWTLQQHARKQYPGAASFVEASEG